MTDQRPFWTSHEEWARIQESGRRGDILRAVDKEIEDDNIPVTPARIRHLIERTECGRGELNNIDGRTEPNPWDEEANERRIDIAEFVLKAIAEGRCADPAACAALVSDFAIHTRPRN